jgi:hypoxanthine phosphoribosyltransferase
MNPIPATSEVGTDQTNPYPMNLQEDRLSIEELISKELIDQRLDELSDEIHKFYGDNRPLMIGLLKGAVVFLADLMRRLNWPVEIDFMGVSSYRGETSQGRLELTGNCSLPLKNRDLLIVDDILDSGNTLARIDSILSESSPKSIRHCVLLEKERKRSGTVQAEFVGFRIPDVFVVGYGLDYQEKFRNLPYIGKIHIPETVEDK